MNPRLAITIGDAAGVGPELALRVAAMPEVQSICEPILYGDANLIARVAEHCGLAISKVVDCGPLDAIAVVPGKFSIDTGRASYETVCTAIDAALAGDVDAIVTGPIQKEAWHDAGIDYPGHTELLADRVGQSDVRMMLCSDEIACVLATIHIPLADVAASLNVPSLLRTIELADQTLSNRLRSRGITTHPRIAVCGLNPHAGENGLFSHGEERDIVAPAIELARTKRLDVTGPLSPDTAFTPAMRKRFDVYVCLYHDQGLIPLKALSFDDAVNVTLGLPIIRTSVDHGTAMDLAWQNIASDRSMFAAVKMAAELANGNSPVSFLRVGPSGQNR